MTSPWTITGELARLRVGKLAAEIAIGFPQRGVSNIVIGDSLLSDAAAHCLAVHTQPADSAAQIQDCYARGTDLVVTYAETPERNIRTQVYWRAFEFPDPHPHSFGVDVIVSTQTSQLDSDPTLLVESCLPTAGENAAVNSPSDGGLILYRLRTPAWSFAQVVHPNDFVAVEASLGSDAMGRIRHRLFAPGLEKGVIRRARVRSIFVPRHRDEQAAAASYAEFVAQELPLTT